jgi:spermidine synthase
VKRTPTTFYLGIGGISAALLICELTLTRIFSVTMWYHMAFLAISLALLGIAAAGITIYLAPRRFPAARLEAQLCGLAAAFAAGIVLSSALLTRIPYRNEISLAGFLKLAAIYLTAAIPFYLGGLAIALVLTHRARDIGRVYLADLCGAALGCLLVIPGLELLGAPRLLLFAAAVALLAGLLFAAASGRQRAALALFCTLAVALALVGLNDRLGLIRIHYVKGEREQGVEFDRWNSFSRVTVTGAATPGSVRSVYTCGLSPRYRGPIPEQKFITIDGVAGTPLTRFDGDLRKLPYLEFEVTSLAYHLRREPSVLIIGPGGGEDVLSALSISHARRVVAVEINPLMREITEVVFADFAGRPYSLPGVELVIDEGRSYTSGTSERFDILQASMVDTWAATTAGAYTLTENNLYTVEAFRQFWNHLSDDGIFTMSRFIFEPPRQTLRVISLCLEVMDELGVEDPAAHLAVITEPAQRVATVLWKRRPFRDEELQRLRELSARCGFLTTYLPGEKGHPTFQALIEAPDRQAFIRDYWFDISPPTDDRPFFFHMIKPRHILEILRVQEGQRFNYVAVFVLASLLGIMALLLAASVIGPLALRRRSGALRGWPRLRAILYFVGLGLAFMLVEVTLVQKFILFLGHPTYALTVILFTLLVFSGLGSGVTHLLPRGRERAWIQRLLPLLVAVLVAQQLVIPAFIYRHLQMSLGGRILATIAFLAPAALLMGMPFPLGIRLLERRDATLIPWAYAVNGAASVMATVTVVFLAMNAGFRVAMAAGYIIYALAASLL